MTDASQMTPHTTNSQKNNKMFLIGGGVALALVIMIGGVFAYSNMQKASKTATPTTQKKKVVAPTNVIPVAERPYVELDSLDIHNLAFKVMSLPKAADSVEYEIEYQTDSSLQGAQDSFMLGSLPAQSKKIPLGSCSAGGACTWHTGIVGGTLLLKFSGSESYALKQEWKYIDNKAKETSFSSKDAKFQIDSKDLATQSIMIIYNSPGYPKSLPGTAISDPYALSAVLPLKGTATLTMRAMEEDPKAVIMGWDGKAWKEFASKVDGKSVTATVDLLPLYVVMKK